MNKNTLLLTCSILSLSFSIFTQDRTPATRFTRHGHPRVAIIGAGAVGATIAYAIMLKNIGAEITLVDIDEKHCYGEVLDLSDALPFCYTPAVHFGTFQDAAHADIIIISAGARRKPGQSRIDLIKVNKSILSSIFNSIGTINENPIILMVSNPVDIMTYLAQQLSGLESSHVFGSGTYLDTQRLRVRIAQEIGISEVSVQAYILGEHGDTQFAPWSIANIAGIPLTDFDNLSIPLLDEMAEETKNKGKEIIEHKGATYYGIGTCVATICESIIFNKKHALPVSCYIEQHDVVLSVPAVIGEYGIERILSISLNENEDKKFMNSVKSLRSVIEQL